mmetsp:Transcript_7290/g.12084  ORF Transcript_7290/g.12084 Transcript_7290/m.12084 type:complete len:203 (-) Transcript_7290:250-858(-)
MTSTNGMNNVFSFAAFDQLNMIRGPTRERGTTVYVETKQLSKKGVGTIKYAVRQEKNVKPRMIDPSLLSDFGVEKLKIVRMPSKESSKKKKQKSKTSSTWDPADDPDVDDIYFIEVLDEQEWRKQDEVKKEKKPSKKSSKESGTSLTLHIKKHGSTSKKDELIVLEHIDPAFMVQTLKSKLYVCRVGHGGSESRLTSWTRLS